MKKIEAFKQKTCFKFKKHLKMKMLKCIYDII